MARRSQASERWSSLSIISLYHHRMPLLADFVLIIDGHHIWALFYPENSWEARFILSPMSKDSFARVLLTLSVLGLGLRIARTYYYLLFTGVIPRVQCHSEGDTSGRGRNIRCMHACTVRL